MAQRMPKDIQGGLSPDTGTSILQAELSAKQAASLGILGWKVEEAMVALRDATPEAAGHPGRLNAATEADSQNFVQRELNGVMDSKDAIEHNGIGPEGLASLGKMAQPAQLGSPEEFE